MDACVYKAESLCSAPETITALLVAYIPVQNKKKKKIQSLVSLERVIKLFLFDLMVPCLWAIFLH